MNLDSILAELKKEWNRLGRAIQALEPAEPPKRRGRKPGPASLETAPVNGRRRHMSAAARRKISEKMKKRWAERKKKAAA